MKAGVDFKTVRRLLRDEFSPYHRLGIIAGLFMVIAALATAAPVIVIKRVIDDVFINTNSALILPIALAVIMIYLVKGASTYAYSLILAKISANISADMRKKVIRKLFAQQIPFFDQTETSDLINRVSHVTNIAADLIRLILTTAIRDLLTVTSLIAVMLYYDWMLTMGVLLVAPLAIWGVSLISRRIRNSVSDEFSKISTFLRLLIERLNGIRLIKSFQNETSSLNSFEENIESLRQRSIAIGRVSALNSPLMEALGGVAVAAMIVYAGWAASSGTSSAGELFAIITGFLSAYEPMKRLANLRVRLVKYTIPLELYYELIDKPNAQRDGKEVLKNPLGDIEFSNVDFAYGDEASALNNLSFIAKSGKTTALIGRSGSGKSTTLALLQRFYDLKKGKISIGKQNINKVKIADLRASIAIIPQETVIFTGTIMENIAIGNPEAGEADILAAAKAAHMDEFVSELDAGYQALLGEGGIELSGGQKQRLSIARAFLKDAPILLLDEATSALDSASEAIIQKAIADLARDKTVIVIAHRLSTIRNADQIIVLDHGKAIESGNHNQLIKKGGAYKALHQLQFHEKK